MALRLMFGPFTGVTYGCAFKRSFENEASPVKLRVYDCQAKYAPLPMAGDGASCGMDLNWEF